MLNWENIAYTDFPPHPMNTEFAIDKLAGYFSHIVRIWTLQNCCFWIYPIQQEQTKATATSHVVRDTTSAPFSTLSPLRQTKHEIVEEFT